MEITQMKGSAPELLSLPVAASRYGLPTEYKEALETFAAAEADYGAGHHDKAATKFMTVAELLKAPSPRTTYSDAFAKMRGIAYKNAAIAFEQASKRAEGVRALTAALKADAENEDVLKKLLSTFN